MSRRSTRLVAGAQLEENFASPQSIENMDSMCSQRQVSDICETTNHTDQTVDKSENNENFSTQQHAAERGEVNGTRNERPDCQLSTSTGVIPKAISINEADMICTTVENVSCVRFEWTVEDFYPRMYECGDMIQSEEFPPYDLQKEFWTLRLYPKSHPHLSKEGINGSLSTIDDSTIQFYLTLCPSHIATQDSSLLSDTATSPQLQVYFRALINFSDLQGRIFHTETVHDCGGKINDEIVLMKMTRATCEQLYTESKDHLIISIELMSIDDITKRSLRTSSTKIVDGSSRFVSKVIKMKLRWKIEHFSILVTESSNNSYIESCEFTFNKQRLNNTTTNLQISTCEVDDENEELKSQNNIPLHQWSLILYPNGKTERFKESLSLFVEHTFGPCVRIVIRFSLIDERGRRINTKQLPSHVLEVGERWGIGDFIKHSTLLQSQEQFIPNNELRLYCQIKILERKSIDEKKFATRLFVPLSQNKSSDDNPATYWPTLFYTAYLEKNMFDMYLRCVNELFPVHKLILALRSSVFARMIKEKETILDETISSIRTNRQSKRTINDNSETNSQPANGLSHSSFLTIDINDIDQKTLPYFLEYIYTGGIKKIALPGVLLSPPLIIDLLTIAMKYDIPDLRTYAEYYLKDIIRVDNACELLVVCDNMKSDMLKQTTCDFIANNLGNIMTTTGWTELKVKQPDLIDIILKSCLLLRK